jgi:hypothetical protein
LHGRGPDLDFTGYSPPGDTRAAYASDAMATWLLMGSSVGWVTTVVAVIGVVLFSAVPVLALRKHDRMFPKDWDRTGWKPESSHSSWFRTKFAWLSGGRG